jgi:hypothetical protein
MFLSGGSGISSATRSPPPEPPKPPPPPQRVADAPVEESSASDDGGSSSAVDKQSSLSAAAQNSEQKVSEAAKANDAVKKLESLPPAQHPQVRDELEGARAEAKRKNADAHRAVQDELIVARQVLSPSYFDDYNSALDRDFASNDSEAAVVREAKAIAPAAARPKLSDPSLAAIESKQEEVNRALWEKRSRACGIGRFG